MASVWYFLCLLLLTLYAVLDGFDLGAALLLPWLGKDHLGRTHVLATIGPFWDGNEVFLVASGGVLFLAFTRALGSMLGGLYLGVFVLLWGLLGRGMAIELRHHSDDPLWTTACDRVVQLSSTVIALVLGAALGNVIRGGALDADGYFQLELFSLASPREGRGILDAYTTLVALFAVASLAMHGALFVAWKGEVGLGSRAAGLAKKVALPVLLLWPIVGVATAWTVPALAGRAIGRPASIGFALLAVFALVLVFVVRHARSAFLASCMFIGANLFAIGAAAFPVLVPSVSIHPSLDVTRAANSNVTLAAGLSWFWLAALLVAAYFFNLFRLHRGRITPPDHETPVIAEESASE